MTAFSFYASYEDREKIAQSGGAEEESAHDLAQLIRNQSTCSFSTLAEAVRWLREAIKKDKTFYGVGDIQKLERLQPHERCGACVCDGWRTLHEWRVSDEGIEEHWDAESQCHV